MFVFRGQNAFEGLLAGYLSHNIWRDENNFLYAPELDERYVEILTRSSVRMTDSDDGEKKLTVFAEDRNEEAGHLLLQCERLYPLMDRYVADGMVALQADPRLPLDFTVNRKLAESIGLPTPYSFDEMINHGYRAVVTTDWKVFMEAFMFGVPAVIVGGPKPPRWVREVAPQKRYVSDLRDNAAMSVCHCFSPERCHSSDAVKPCMTKARWDSVASRIVDGLA